MVKETFEVNIFFDTAGGVIGLVLTWPSLMIMLKAIFVENFLYRGEHPEPVKIQPITEPLYHKFTFN